MTTDEIPIRGCCGKTYYAFLDVIEGLSEPARITGLRWGEQQLPLDLVVGSKPPEELVDLVFAAVEEHLNRRRWSLSGSGALLVERSG